MGADGGAAEGSAWPWTTLSAWPGKSRAVPPWVTLLYLYEPRGDTGHGDFSPSDGEHVVPHPGNLSISPKLDLRVFPQTAQPCTGPGPAQASTQSCAPTVPSSGPRGQMGTPGVMLTAQEPSGSLGVLGGGQACVRDAVGRAAGRSPRRLRRDVWVSRCTRSRARPGILSSSPRHCASRGTACRRGGR